MAAHKIRSQQELFEDNPRNGVGAKPARNSILRRPSSGAFPAKQNPRDPARRVLSRGYSASRGAKTGTNKIEDLFDTHFSMEASEYAQILDAANHAANRGEQASCKEIQALRNTMGSILEEIDTLKAKCIVVEERYKDATITASQELQQSMNILFQLQQKTSNLQDSSANVEKLTDELKSVKLRLASKDKERRTYKSESEYKEKTIQEQAAQIAEMNAMLGGTSEELAQRSIDAKRANALWEDLSTAKNKIKDLKAENGRLTTRTHELEGLLEADGGGDTVVLHQRLQTAIEEKQKLEAELAAQQEELNNSKNECSRLREAMGAGGAGGSDTAVQVERELREQAEQRAEQERTNRVSAQLEWNTMSEQVVSEMDSSRKQVEDISSQARDVENKLVESRAETRKAQLMVAELKGTSSSSYDVKVVACVKGASGGGSKVKGSYVRLSSDGVSVKLSLPTPADNGEAATPVVQKFVYDKVLNAGEAEFPGQVGVCVDSLILAALSGEHACAAVYGAATTDKTLLTFGPSGLVNHVLSSCAASVKSLSSEWDIALTTTFVKIFEEDIVDMFSENPEESKSHEVVKTEDGTISVSNINLVPMNADDDEEIQSIGQLASGTYEVFSGSDHGLESHYVFSIQCRAVNKRDGSVKEGKFSLAHLCGAEFGASSRSLQCFRDIFAGITKRQAHVAYRNTKLTYILQSALSVGGHTTVFACADASDVNTFEVTKGTFEFARQAFECIINPPSSSSSSGGKLSKSIDGRKSKSSSGSKSVSSKASSSSKASKSGSSSKGTGKFKLNL